MSAFFKALLLVIALIGFVTPVKAGIVNVYEVSNIKVDVTAETAAKAQDQALAQGERQAFDALMKRLVVQDDLDLLPIVSAEDLKTYVQDMGIISEKRSSVRYIAELSVRFKEAYIRELLTSNGVSFSETPSKPVLILPVFQSSKTEQPIIWDDPNPWRQAWTTMPERHSLVPTVLPMGDLADIAAIGAEQAVSGNQVSLQGIASRYGVIDVAVAHARVKLNSIRGTYEVEVTLTRYSPDGALTPIQQVYPVNDGEEIQALLGRAAIGVSRVMEDDWKRRNLLTFGETGYVAVNIPISGIHDWLEIKKRIDAMAVVKKNEVVLMSREQVRVNIQYFGTLGQLDNAMTQADMELRPNGDDWMLKLKRRGRG